MRAKMKTTVPLYYAAKVTRRHYPLRELDPGQVDRLVRSDIMLETIQEVYVVATDAIQIPRLSQKMPGTSWLRALRIAIFCRDRQVHCTIRARLWL
jgi:hypothetical protein